MKYDDLDEYAQKKAREWMVSCLCGDWDGDDEVRFIEEVFGKLGVTFDYETRPRHKNARRNVSWSNGQGSYFHFAGYWKGEDVDAAGLAGYGQDVAALVAPAMALFLRYPTERVEIGYARSSCYCVLDYVGEEEVPDGMEDEFNEFIKTICDWASEVLVSGYDDCYDDDSAVETIRANEYDFEEDGEKV